jgi:hypothetical protein
VQRLVAFGIAAKSFCPAGQKIDAKSPGPEQRGNAKNRDFLKDLPLLPHNQLVMMELNLPDLISQLFYKPET